VLFDPLVVYSVMKKAFAEARCCTIMDIATATPEQVAAELHKRCKCGPDPCSCTFEEQLTGPQRVRLRDYRRIFAKRNHDGQMPPPIFHLGDNPKKRLVWSGKSGAMPTCRTSMGFLWFEPLNRWLFANEIAKAMGWESLDHFDHGTRFIKLLGNSMHLANATAILALTLACTPSHAAAPAARAAMPRTKLMETAFEMEKKKACKLANAFKHELRRSSSSCTSSPSSSPSTSPSKVDSVELPKSKTARSPAYIFC
jgi:hypothetical protein